MVAATHHRIRLHAPHYAAGTDGTMVHRYLEDQFVPRFMQEAATGRLTGTAAQIWRNTDRFGRHKDLPMLRLPMHRTFYLTCCEASCDMPGAPALDPKRIVSAAMVVRRGADGGSAARWLLRDGEPQGWRAGEIPDYEPNEHRRLTARGLIPPRLPEPPPSGEETYPMHPLVVESSVAGHRRKHTLLFGYLPLGGSYRVSADNPAEPAPGAQTPDYAAEHAWPFGTRNRVAWRQTQGLAVKNGTATAPFRELVATLVGRYQVHNPDLPDNAALRTLLGRVYLYRPAPAVADAGGDPTLASGDRVRSLLAYLDRRADAILEWLAAIDRGDRTEGSPLPAYDGSGVMNESLYVTEAQAEDIRDLLVVRAEQAVESSADALPIPRFGQGRDDIYFAKPFIRYRDEKGCERVAWGPASHPFRVAAPLDPEAARPQLVALPDLDDIKRGVAKGVTFLSPKSLADKIQQLKLDMDVGTGGDGNRLGACFSFSFSLPAITLCAMILLMIMINLLNILFFWIPYVFLALPRLCLKLLVRS
jgi:hypothetical protein